MGKKKGGNKSNATKASATGLLPQTPFAAAIVANDIAAIEAQASQVLGLPVTVSQLLQQQAEQFTSGHSTPVHELHLEAASGPMNFIVKLVSVPGSDAHARFRAESYAQVGDSPLSLEAQCALESPLRVRPSGYTREGCTRDHRC